MRENHSGRIVPNGALDDLARVNARSVDGSRKEDLARQDPVPVVERHHDEILPLL